MLVRTLQLNEEQYPTQTTEDALPVVHSDHDRASVSQSKKTMDVETLADLIFRRVYSDGPFTFTELEERSKEKGIDIDLFYAAMEIVNKNRKLAISGQTYKRRAPKKENPISHTTWVRENYPEMIPGVNDASHEAFSEIDFSFLFLTPEEAKIYKEQMKYGHVNPRRKDPARYSKKT